jgi:superfamily II DNA or RNA helicase
VKDKSNREWINLESPFPELDAQNFPTNEGNTKVRDQLIADCSNSSSLRIITGYSGLDQIVWFIARYAKSANIEIVFGSEPKISNENRLPTRTVKLSDEMRDYWLERGLSPKTNSSILETISAIEAGRVTVKLHTERFMHAKAYVTEKAATFGSSNFSTPGLVHSRELNGRFTVEEPRYKEILKFVNGCWEHSENYSEKLLQLLRELQLHATWKEALARSCAALLEGDWANDLIPDGLKSEFQSLWPHQRQGIAQALTVLETQGAVVIADPTGSGKTNTGGWLIRLAYQRMLSKGGMQTTSLIPVVVSPSSVENNWYQILDQVGVAREVLSQGILSNPRKDSSKRRLELIEKTNLLAVDEIHNYYNLTRNRSKALTNNLAESRIFMTATPINKNYKDLITLMNLLGTEDLDGDTFRQLKNLEDKINHTDPEVKEEARGVAKQLIQQFMVRRTRSELKAIATNRPEEYKIGERSANYPGYISEEYELETSSNDEQLITEIKELVSSLKGISRIRELKLSSFDIEIKRTESSYLNGRVRGSASLAKWHLWDRLNSSPIALLEHIHGTEEIHKMYDLKTGNSRSKGVLNSTSNSDMPEWKLGNELKDSSDTPKWLYDREEFEKAKSFECKLYQQISDKVRKLSAKRLESKIDIILDHFQKGKKVLVFDHCIVSLYYVKKILDERQYETYMFIGSSGEKKKRVRIAEEKFGLYSDDVPRVALLSDSMSEGINLQGSSVLIHFTSPTTVRNAEQRAGRVDRMNSIFDEIEIFYPQRDTISEMMKDHLAERCKLVGDVIGSNLKLPGEDIEEVTLDELELNHKDITEVMGTNREGLFDAFHNVRELIGSDKLISDEDYENMRTSKAKVLSYIGLVKSEKPWCFFVIQTNKNWAPQWVLLDYSKKAATQTRGIYTKVDKICEMLGDNLASAEDMQPSTHADEWVTKYLEHVEKYEYNLLPMRRRALLKQMNDVLNEWQKKLGFHNDIGKELGYLKRAALSAGEYRLDLRQLASTWNDFYREYREKLNLSTLKGRGKQKKTLEMIKDTPPADIENFIQRFSHVDAMESIDPRTIAMIAGVPNYIDSI